MTTNGLRLLVVFAIGFVTWLLVFTRSFALDTRRAWLLSCVVFADEAVGIGIGVWLARNGSLCEILAVAAGGTVAAAIAVRMFKRYDER